MLLADIAAKFAKFLWGLVENVPIIRDVAALVKGARESIGEFGLKKGKGPTEAPAEGRVGPQDVPTQRDAATRPAEADTAGRPADADTGGRPADADTAGRPGEASDVAATAEQHGIPPERLQAEVGELRQKASNPENVRDPADPRFDAEMDAQGHTFDREQSSKSWCRHTEEACGLSLGSDLNSKVDAALKEKPGEGRPGEVTETPTEKPVEPTEVAEPVDPMRAQLERDLAEAKVRKTDAERTRIDLQKKAQAERARANELDRQAAIAKGEAKSRLSQERRAAENSAREAEQGAAAAEKKAIEAQLEIQKKTAQLNTDARSKLPCFAAGTAVWTPSGSRPIEVLSPDDIVLSYDFERGSCVQHRILEVYRNQTLRFWHIDVDGTEILATSLHRFWVEGETEWVEARHLRAGMQLRTTSGRTTTISRVETREAPHATTFNLRIEETPTYFVGPGVLVHNAGAPSYSFGPLRIYEATNPTLDAQGNLRFKDEIYIGQTDDIARRQMEHRAEAVEQLQRTDLTPEQREFWEFKKDVVLKERVSGLNADQANYLEQRNMDLEKAARGEKNVMNRREQVSRKNMVELEQRIKADPKVQEAGFCP
jgi:hypothetical protein